jgi:hypothetical protein
MNPAEHGHAGACLGTRSCEAGHDPAYACSKARWDGGERRTEFGIPGRPICGTIDNDVPNAAYGWQYALYCPVFDQHRRGRRYDRAGCVAEAEHWLDVLGCPWRGRGASATEWPGLCRPKE